MKYMIVEREHVTPISVLKSKLRVSDESSCVESPCSTEMTDAIPSVSF